MWKYLANECFPAFRKHSHETLREAVSAAQPPFENRQRRLLSAVFQRLWQILYALIDCCLIANHRRFSGSNPIP